MFILVLFGRIKEGGLLSVNIKIWMSKYKRRWISARDAGCFWKMSRIVVLARRGFVFVVVLARRIVFAGARIG